jgi:hypothetical protein
MVQPQNDPCEGCFALEKVNLGLIRQLEELRLLQAEGQRKISKLERDNHGLKIESIQLQEQARVAREHQAQSLSEASALRTALQQLTAQSTQQQTHAHQ